MPKRGFTLIELLIVIAIILILIAIALPNFLEAQIRARLTNTRACLNTYRTANEAYFTDFNIHAPDVDGGERSNGIPPISWEQAWGVRGIRCNGSEICTFMMLTTPIAYMKDLCFDPFLKDRGETSIGKNISLPEYTTYLSGSDQRKIWGNSYGLRYIILSRGPDLDGDAGNYDQIWHDLGAHVQHITQIPRIYAPTNGTKSDGDLIVSNRGHEMQ